MRDDERLASVLRRPMGFEMGLKTVVASNRPPGISNNSHKR